MLIYRLSCPITLSLSEATDFLTCYYCLALFFPSFQPINGKFYIVAHLCFSRGNISDFPANLNNSYLQLTFYGLTLFYFITNL